MAVSSGVRKKFGEVVGVRVIPLLDAFVLIAFSHYRSMRRHLSSCRIGLNIPSIVTGNLSCGNARTIRQPWW
jgi:hypothetical protein